MAPKLKRGSVHISSSRSHNNDSDDKSVTSDELTSVIHDVDKRLKEHREHLKGLTKSYEFMSETFDKLQTQITKLNKEGALMKKQIKTIPSNESDIVKRIQALEKQGAALKQIDNANNMIITNMPKIDENTNSRDVIVKIGQQVNHQIKQDEVLEVQQYEKKGNTKYKSYPIIVKLADPTFKTKCMEYRKTKKLIDVTLIPCEIGEL